MKILAVSDNPSQSLETLISRYPERFKDVRLLVSCGDLDREYLEFLADGLRRDLFFVYGNHAGEGWHECETGRFAEEGFLGKLRTSTGKILRHIAGKADMHGRVEIFGDYIITGFGGSQWYSGQDNQYSEREMSRYVRRAERKIRWYRLLDRLAGHRLRRVIVISHAPVKDVHDQPDVCHRGFKCFRDFIEHVSPLVWIHGHIHIPDTRQNQVSRVGRTTVINAYGCRIINIENDDIEVFSHCDIDNCQRK
jgi:Icc-related predicted phosphoesterase